MNQIQFSAFDGDELIVQSEWLPENHPTDAPTALAEFSKDHPDGYSYRIEHKGDSKTPNLTPLFRYNIFVRSGSVPVVDDDGMSQRQVQNATLKSRSFYEWEREKVLAEIHKMWPNAELTEEKING
jgi:hypothetical protein